jgi:hypothetical protein
VKRVRARAGRVIITTRDSIKGLGDSKLTVKTATGMKEIRGISRGRSESWVTTNSISIKLRSEREERMGREWI